MSKADLKSINKDLIYKHTLKILTCNFYFNKMITISINTLVFKYKYTFNLISIEVVNKNLNIQL